MKLLQKHKSITALLRVQLKRKPTNEEIDYFWLKFCEDRYLYDYEFYAIACLTIRDKESGQEIPFLLNNAQRMCLAELERQRKEERQINAMILKAKQMGFSTLVQMYMQWIQTIHKTNWNSVVVAQDLTAATNVRSMYDNSIRDMVPIGGVKHTIGSFAGLKNIKIIPERGCRITVGTAEKPDSVRSQDLKMVHFSEMAFYPKTEGNNPELIESSIISSLTDGAYTMIVRESTANGVGDYFHEQWQKAKEGKTAYTPIFAPFYIIPLYEENFDGYYYLHNGRRKKGTMTDFIGTLNEYEWNLWNNHERCTLENINWRRKKAATMPSESKMRQEYPADDIEAFQDSGTPVFRADDVEAMRKDCRPPVAIGTLIAKVPPESALLEPHKQKDILQNIRFVANPAALEMFTAGPDEATRYKAGMNKVHIWQYPDKDQNVSDRYVVVFDPQRGTSEGADYGVIKVIDRYWMMEGEGPEVVAMFYGHIDKDITMWIATMIAKWYNNALLVVESNVYDSDTGKEDETEFIFDVIAEHYDNLYSRTPAEKIRQGAPVKYGFHMGKNNKPMIINHYIALLRERAYTERDNETLNEARYFETKKNGKTGAQQGKHDDRIVATMIGLYICYELPTPKIIKPVPRPPMRKTAW